MTLPRPLRPPAEVRLGAPAPAELRLRAPAPADAEALGRIAYLAARRASDCRGFPPDFPSAGDATGLIRALSADPRVFGIVATAAGRPVGSAFLDERGPIRGLGPVTVDPAVQGAGIGRRLMAAAIDRGRSGAGLRLVQAAGNAVGVALCAGLGFVVREPLALVAGRTRGRPRAPGGVRPMEPGDVAAAAALCRAVTGCDRRDEIAAAVDAGTALALVRAGRLAGYVTAPERWIASHAVAESDACLAALILGAGALGRPIAFLLPVRRARLLRFALAQGLRLGQPMLLMTRGAHAEPRGASLPSIHP